MQDYARTVSEAASSNRINDVTAARNAERGWGSSPTARATTILTAIPQVGTAGAQKLMPFLTQVTDPKGRGPNVLTRVSPGERASSMEMEEARMLDALRSTKFDDPSMEAYRKAAIQHWAEYSEISDLVMNTFVNSIKKK